MYAESEFERFSDLPARVWNQRDRTDQRSQARSVQQPTAPSNLVRRGGNLHARQDYEELDTRDYQDSGRAWAYPSSPEFSIRWGAFPFFFKEDAVLFAYIQEK